MIELIFVGDRLICRKLVWDGSFSSPELRRRPSLGFACWKCGQVWARRVRDPNYWFFHSRGCPRCLGGASLLLLPERDAILDSRLSQFFPKELLKWEVLHNKFPFHYSQLAEDDDEQFRTQAA